ncbi:MAG: hypothetical protein AB7U40_08250 [Methanobacteriales archaeon]
MDTQEQVIASHKVANGSRHDSKDLIPTKTGEYELMDLVWAGHPTRKR